MRDAEGSSQEVFFSSFSVRRFGRWNCCGKSSRRGPSVHGRRKVFIGRHAEHLRTAVQDELVEECRRGQRCGGTCMRRQLLPAEQRRTVDQIRKSTAKGNEVDLLSQIS